MSEAARAAESLAQDRVDVIQSSNAAEEAPPTANFDMPADPAAPPVPTPETSTAATRAMPPGADGFEPDLDIPFRQGSFELGVPDLEGFGEVPAQAQAPGGPMEGGQLADALGYDAATEGVILGHSVPVARGALLSLIIQLQPPDDAVARQFRYFGTAGADEDDALNITYSDRTGGGMLSLLVAAGLTLLFWMQRKTSVSYRAKLAALTIAGPLGLMTTAPADWLPILDGLFLGGIIGVSLWLIRGCVPCCLNWCMNCCRKGPETTTISTALLAALLLNCASASAQEPAVVPAPQPTTVDAPSIIIPYEPGTDPTTAERVFLPQETFLKLWNQAHPEDRRNGPAPVNGLVSEALYVAQLFSEGDEPRVSVTGRYLLHNLSRGQVTLPAACREYCRAGGDPRSHLRAVDQR